MIGHIGWVWDSRVNFLEAIFGNDHGTHRSGFAAENCAYRTSVVTVDVRTWATYSCQPRALILQIVLLAVLLFSGVVTGVGGSRRARGTTVRFVQQADKSEQSPDANAHSYLDEPLKKLVKRIPELKGVWPAANQQAPPMILGKTGEKVDEFFDNLVDLVAHEEITQARSNEFRAIWESEQVQDSYLILRHREKGGASIDEYRMDEKGNRMDEVGLDKGFFVTSGFALSCVHFSTAFQPDSMYRYLGDQNIEGRDSYVVGFAQQPGKASITVSMRGPSGTTVHMLVQGVVWVDKGNFHITRMRTDLLARHPEIGLDEQTTKVNFGEVRLMDVATPLWLPRNVNVFVKLRGLGQADIAQAFLNVHHYKNCRRYRVSAKIVAPQ